MARWSRRTVLASLGGVALLALPGVARMRAQMSTPAAGAATATPAAHRGALLPRDDLLSLAAVQDVVPEMATELATGENETAIGNPEATRSVTFATGDGARRVVISVDRYRSARDASVAFQEAAAKSREVPGATGEPVSNLGDAAFIGVVTQGDETHVGGGALFADVIVAVTLQGYDGTDENKARVTELIRRQAAQAKQASK